MNVQYNVDDVSAAVNYVGILKLITNCMRLNQG